MVSFPKKHPVWTAVICYLLVCAGLAAFAVYWLFFDLQRVPTEERILESKSPDDRYTLTVYRNNGGATVPFMLSGELTDSEKPNRSKIIYWAKGESAETEWLAPDTVRINAVELRVPKETYDYRNP
ncbi:hypothetical protein NCCP2716_13260 [Sporosarcina sp. NCCP-2716]|uniref:DUF5412 family protein n=1 Tax=Sporosarcina sp. NCCP-2716 TaxID=2943679 RepID=UPI00203C489C|nr:DUF5412 family protein [Sporosarcina sp. NCCP-2716]GKV68828.1 hypothetical protein NCCP2716_13260 [Sporosarcina sp. NCCP-2716]